ncbi:hypothetical protein [Polaribacter dokdonensis]|jgi:hypothetical protein|uniref:Uncharacterized protein n=1 Tax=Polaribacter dokdonensis DSW-5 TaxID=1300348 RepID=A0A0M9CFZ2_9FLAO|nr:hypothetical protein [Polaribacter dokdonensis]KOY51636.1 hypothetical protein I602_1196 [Polaribacter dokdonensis DSW-5]SEE06633.1 hypothetical protein SAMN05444353_0576 [Polaribacter dokdonensis DSW-5]
MKNLRKIIALFSVIFVAGILITVVIVNTTLNKTEIPKETVEVQQDTLSIRNTKNKTV